MKPIKVPVVVKRDIPKLEPELEKWLDKRELKRIKKNG